MSGHNDPVMFIDEWEQLSRPAIRPATPSDVRAIARIHVDGWRSTYRGIIPDDALEALSYADRERTWMRLIAGGDTGPFVYVADHPRDGIIGFIAGSTERTDSPEYTGEISVIYVADEHQGKGIGRNLVNYVTRLMMENAHRGMMLWAFADSPANGFFTHLGGKEIARRRRTIGDATVEEIAFGWPSMDALLAASDEHDEPESSAEEPGEAEAAEETAANQSADVSEEDPAPDD